jgi:hypothetical protein
MGGGVDAVRAAGDHDTSGECQPSPKLARELERVFVGSAGPYDSHRPAELRQRSADVQLSRTIGGPKRLKA